MIINDTMESRPVYGGLAVDRRAKSHLIVVENGGAGLVLDAFTDARDCLERSIIFYAADVAAAERDVGRFAGLGAPDLRICPTQQDLLERLGVFLRAATMGTRIYVAGSEDFIGAVVAIAARHGVLPEALVCEKLNSHARRVQCVHCKHIVEHVTVSPYRCPGCDQYLLVRDHYSRRIGAFQGVRIDAETPGEVPAAEELRQ